MNDHLLPISSELPHDGYKQSGYGKEVPIKIDWGPGKCGGGLALESACRRSV
jgi:hypothetical protein